MAKEMMIIFVYDTQLLKNEGDDPATAILYFHPTWVSDQQKVALCGQIMGATHFFKSIFSCPKVISLQSGKFSIKEHGRYVLAVGTDRNIADWVLEYRADTLSSLITFFHYDIEVMSQLYKTTENLSAKLYHMFETYLKILTYSSNLFSNIPNIQLPKSASNVFLDSIQILQCCQEVEKVLGGTMLYHNKVVSTQLSSNLTKRLILTDPYRIKSPAEIVEVDYQLPLGVQLFHVYVEGDDYQDLLEDATRCRLAYHYLNKKSTSKKQPQFTKEPVMTAMKRDQSIIFTTVPEEDPDAQSPVNTDNVIINTKPLTRPKFLNLRNKCTTDEPPKAAPTPTTFHGQTSVCSTPMADLNKVLHFKPVSICENPEKFIETKKELITEEVTNILEKSTSLNSLLSNISEDKMNLNNKTPYLVVNKDSNIRPSFSVQDVTKKQPESPVKTKNYKTIADPTFPVFKSDGSVVSESLYDQYLNKHVDTLHSEATKISITNKKDDWKAFDFVQNSNDEKTLNNINKNSKPKEARKSLSLPLRSLSVDSGDVFTPSGKSSVQLTPLISKLSLLAMEERSSGFCSRDTTPSEFKDYRFTPTVPNRTFLSAKKEEGKFRKEIHEKLKKGVLFICGQQDMVVTLLLEEGACDTPDIVNKLWEMCVDSLNRLEKNLRTCLEMYSVNSAHSENGETYSYLTVDTHCDSVSRGGPWGAAELGALTHLHRDFKDSKGITEILLRDDDCIIYGHNCGTTEVFYMQAANSNAGLPTPADPMGVVTLKAKRRLERDHAIILL